MKIILGIFLGAIGFVPFLLGALFELLALAFVMGQTAVKEEIVATFLPNRADQEE